MPPGFPYQDLLLIADFLEAAEVFVPGYRPPPVGLYHPDGFLYEGAFERVKTVLLPDRNIVSRLAQVAKGEPIEGQRRLAAAVLAFAQCLDIEIEPSIAFHELAPNQGNDAACDELSWFRVADNGNVLDWVAAALGRKHRMQPTSLPVQTECLDLAKPLRRWRRNYIMALKIGELELSAYRPLDRVLRLFDWMYRDFIRAGPAAMFACVYFAPNSPPRQGLLKQLRSPVRRRAVEGARNAAWDITHLSDFVRRAAEEPDGRSRFIFATLDEGLRFVARLLFGYDYDSTGREELAIALHQWWPIEDARQVSDSLIGYFARERSPEWQAQQTGRSNYIDELTTRGEAFLLNWSHTSQAGQA